MFFKYFKSFFLYCREIREGREGERGGAGKGSFMVFQDPGHKCCFAGLQAVCSVLQDLTSERHFMFVVWSKPLWWPSEELSLWRWESCPLGDELRVGSGGPGAAETDANRDFLFLCHRWLLLVFLHPAMNWW